MSRLKRLASLGAIALVLVAGFFFGLVPGILDGLLNQVDDAERPRLSERAIALHEDAFVVDLHADALLWARDLSVRNTRGHVDFPRLQEGNVALQVFSAVTKSPRGLNYSRNRADSDDITPLSVVSLWPVETWSSLEARAHYQARKLRAFLERTGQPLVRVREDLPALADRSSPRRVGALLAIEGLHCAEGELDAIDRLFVSGYRIFGLAHFFDNAFAGSAHGVKKHGLTALGTRALERIETLEGIVDLAHSSPTTIENVLERATRPVVVSHTGVRATCKSPRNLSDEQLRALAKNGALIGIGFWSGALCDTRPAAFARAARHAIEVAGIDHVALGSDFDGSTRVGFDTSELALITQALIDVGLTEAEVRAVLGDNARRFLQRWLPAGSEVGG